MDGRGFSMPRGSGFFLLIVFRARFRRVWSIIVVLSPIWNLNLDGIIVPFWGGNSGALSDSEMSDDWDASDWASWEFCSSCRYCMSRLISELVSLSQIAAGVRLGFWSSRLSK